MILAGEFVAKEYWEKRLGEDWSLQGVGYLGFGLPYNSWLYRLRRLILNRHLATFNVDLTKARILDVGSGTGFWIETWRALGAKKITGSDLTAVSVERLRAEFPGTPIEQIDISNKSEASVFANQFDIVSAFDVLFHITDDSQFSESILNIAQCLSPNGYFVFSDNFVHGKAKRAIHQVSRSLEEIEKILACSGLTVVRRVPVFVLMNAPLDSRSRLAMQVWRLFLAPVRLFPWLGYIWGPILFPVEVIMTRLIKESPSTEMMICHKRADSAQESSI